MVCVVGGVVKSVHSYQKESLSPDRMNRNRFLTYLVKKREENVMMMMMCGWQMAGRKWPVTNPSPSFLSHAHSFSLSPSLPHTPHLTPPSLRQESLHACFPALAWFESGTEQDNRTDNMNHGQAVTGYGGGPLP